jgi:hypothetical protein
MLKLEMVLHRDFDFPLTNQVEVSIVAGGSVADALALE